MPKNIPITQIEEKNKIFSNNAYVVLLHIEVKDVLQAGAPVVQNLYLCNNDEDIVYDGNTYGPFNFEIELKEEVGGQPNVSLSLNDVTRTVQYQMQAYNGGVGSVVNIMVVNENALSGPPDVIERFEVINASASNYNVSWSLGTQNLVAIKFPNRTQMRDRCPWKYKDASTCAYAGPEPSCDYTLQGPNGCSAKGNEANFGGFPGLRTLGVRYV